MTTTIDPTQRTDTDAVIEAVRAGSDPREIDRGQIYVITDETGKQNIVSTDSYLDVPRDYLTYVRHIDSTEAFLDYLTNHDAGDTEIWAHLTPQRDRTEVVAILDASTNCLRKAHLRFDETRRWRDWQQVSGNYYDQEQFAEFLEDHTEDLHTPDAATMLEIAQSLRVSMGTTFSQSKRLADGQTQFVYKEDLEGKAGAAGNLTIPETITLVLQPYTTSKAFKVEAKFRYRLNAGVLRVGVKLMNADKVLEHVFDSVVGDLRAADAAPVYLGRP